MEAEKQNFPENGTLMVFVHLCGEECKPLQARQGDSLREALARAGVATDSGLVVLVGEPGTPLETDEIIDDIHLPANLDDKLRDHVVGRHVHVHCHHCHYIEVVVHYESHSHHRKFSPARTIAQVRRWAIHKFKLGGDAAADKLVLELCESDKRPRPEERLGEVVEHHHCEVCFTLQPSIAPQGREGIGK